MFGPIDWISLIAELQACGLSQAQIAEKCVCGQSTISEIARGITKDPRHSIGEAIRSLIAEKRAEADAAKQLAGEPEQLSLVDRRERDIPVAVDRRQPASASAEGD